MQAKGAYDSFSITSNVGTGKKLSLLYIANSLAGIEIRGKCNKQISKDFSQYNKKGEYKPPLEFEFEFYQSVNFNMHDEDTVFNLGKQDAFRDIGLAYVSDTQNLGWYHYTALTLSASVPDQKKVSVKFAHGGSAQWTDDRTPNTKTPNMLKLQFTLPAKFQTKDKSVTEKILFWDKDNADAPDQYKDIDISLPTLDFKLSGLDYFLTTNLILPGAQVFIADEPSGKKGANFGLFMPRDVILTGQVATDLKEVK
jgi:hypothetical protein